MGEKPRMLELAAESDVLDGEDSPPQRVGRYLLFNAIASGGMATVYWGRLMGPGGFSRVVAIKRVHAHLATNPKFVAMLLDEARLLARIRHPNVVSVLDIVEMPRDLCLVMEYVDGESVARLAANTTGLQIPIAIAAAVMVGALTGLHAAHEAASPTGVPLNIVHRDVSPQNIMVGRDGHARVVDFGIALAAERIQETTGEVLKGKAAYLAPEQLEHGPVDRRVDVRAAAVVFWELLAGRRLFEGAASGQIIKHVLLSDPRAPSIYNPLVCPELDAIVMRGLAREPAHRFSSAAEMAAAIDKAVGIASPQEVGRWVMEQAGESLAARAAIVDTIEQYKEQGDQSHARISLRLNTLGADDSSAPMTQSDAPPPLPDASIKTEVRDPVLSSQTQATNAHVTVSSFEPSRTYLRQPRRLWLAVAAVVVAAGGAMTLAPPTRPTPATSALSGLAFAALVSPPAPEPTSESATPQEGASTASKEEDQERKGMSKASARQEVPTLASPPPSSSFKARSRPQKAQSCANPWIVGKDGIITVREGCW